MDNKKSKLNTSLNIPNFDHGTFSSNRKDDLFNLDNKNIFTQNYDNDSFELGGKGIDYQQEMVALVNRIANLEGKLFDADENALALNKTLEEINTKINSENGINISLEKQKVVLDDNSKKIENIYNDFSRYKIDFIAILGVFVSIFTFISIEIQILRYLTNPWIIIAFSFIMFGLMSSFPFVLSYLTSYKDDLEKNYFKIFPYFLLCLMPIFLGLLIITFQSDLFYELFGKFILVDLNII
jgi:uncharacterized membrane protein